jgi:hypothetical protein
VKDTILADIKSFAFLQDVLTNRITYGAIHANPGIDMLAVYSGIRDLRYDIERLLLVFRKFYSVSFLTIIIFVL